MFLLTILAAMTIGSSLGVTVAIITGTRYAVGIAIGRCGDRHRGGV